MDKDRINKLIDNLIIEPLKMKEITVIHYNHPVKTNSGLIRFQGHPYILNYLYKAGIGSRRSQGFGLVEVVK